MNVAHYSSLADLPSPYEDFFLKAGRRGYLASAAWLKTVVETTLERSARLHLFAAESGSGVPLALLAMRSPAGQNGSILAERRVWGSALANLTNHQCPLFEPLLSPELEDPSPILTILAEGMAAQSKACSLIDLNLLDPLGGIQDSLVSGFRAAGWLASGYVHRANWFENTEGLGFDSYMKSGSKASRKAKDNYRRKERRLLEGGGLTMKMIVGTDGLDDAIRDYDTVYAASWKEPEPYPAFVPALIRSAAATGALRLLIVSLEGKPAATELAILSNGRATMMKTAYDPAFSKSSIGSIAIMRMIEHLLDRDGVSEIDFGNDDDPYKKVWVTQRRMRHGLLAYNPRRTAGLANLARSRAEDALRGGGRAVRRLVSKGGS